jgi:hypothetical protein
MTPPLRRIRLESDLARLAGWATVGIYFTSWMSYDETFDGGVDCSDSAASATLIPVACNDDGDQVIVKALSVADPNEPRAPLVTVIARLDPVGAVPDTVIVAVIMVPAPFTLTDEKVTPTGPDSLASELKPVPVTVKLVVSPRVTP